MNRPFEKIGRYRLLEPIGEGRFGTVWVALNPGGDKVAIKLANEGVDRSVFKEEAELLSRADCNEDPGIVDLLEDLTDRERPALVLTYCSRGSIRDHLDDVGPYRPREACEILVSVAKALKRAHGRGVLHLDLKPENILFLPQGTPQLADFGLGQAHQKEELALSFVTRGMGAVGGTFDYMAPEVKKGRKPSPRADVYALGVILYEMVSGFLPAGRFPPLSSVVAGEGAEVPDGLDDLIRDAMRPRPTDRIELEAFLDRLQQLYPKGRFSQTIKVRLERPPEDSPWPMVVVGGGVAFLLILLAQSGLMALAVLGAAVGLGGLFMLRSGGLALYRFYLIEKTPTANPNRISEGLCELEGIVRLGPEPVVAPGSGVECAVCRYSSYRPDTGSHSQWTTTSSFLCETAQGPLAVDLGTAIPEDLPHKWRSKNWKNGDVFENEYRLDAGDPIYILGVATRRQGELVLGPIDARLTTFVNAASEFATARSQLAWGVGLALGGLHLFGLGMAVVSTVLGLV